MGHRFHILAAAIAAAAFLSCEKDSTIFYNETTMGNIVDGMFISDYGIGYNVVEQTCLGKLDTMKRALITCDILAGNDEGTYDIRLKEIASVLTKEPVFKSGIADDEVLGNDAIIVRYAWFSKNYLNIGFDFTFLKGSSRKHLVNLVYDDVRSMDADTLYFTLRHNGYGEVYGKTDNFSSGRGYASFPVGILIPEDKKEMPVRISYPWYKTEDGHYVPETEVSSTTGIYRR